MPSTSTSLAVLSHDRSVRRLLGFLIHSLGCAARTTTAPHTSEQRAYRLVQSTHIRPAQHYATQTTGQQRCSSHTEQAQISQIWLHRLHFRNHVCPSLILGVCMCRVVLRVMCASHCVFSVRRAGASVVLGSAAGCNGHWMKSNTNKSGGAVRVLAC